MKDVNLKETPDKKDGKVKRSVCWGVSAYKIVMENKIVIAGCLLIHGLIYVIRPEHSLEWDVRIMAGLTVLYALISAAFLITNGNQKTENGKKLIGGWYKELWNDKQEQMTGSRDKNIPKNELISKRNEAAKKRDEKIKRFLERKQKNINIKKWHLISVYIILSLVCIPMVLFASVTKSVDNIVHFVLGVIIATEGVFSIITLIKTKDSVILHNRIMSFLIAIFSIILGTLLIAFPENTAVTVMRIVGIGFVLKAITEIFIGFRNRSLIMDTKDTVSQIKSL